ncbi:MAG TPA: DUF1801 domain-containing protein [Thermoplasmata archaeon]|nr:DUF1801 domain-containing protein [Thermoplasmata archaeon]
MVTLEREVHAVIRCAGPRLRRVTKWANRWYADRDLVVVAGRFAHHVGIEFWRGSSLADPDHLLEGTGKNLRHVKIRTLAEARSPKLMRLLRRAVALDRQEPPRVR